MMFALRDTLERRYDGPIPPADPAHPPLAAALRARLFQRLAKEVREQTAQRRARLAGAGVLGDEKLHRLQCELLLYRSQGMLWRLAKRK